MTTFLIVQNNAVSTLTSGIDDAVTSLTVASGEGALFPSTYPFHISIEDEILSCTARSTDTLTVVRAQQSTAAASHASGMPVELRVTAKSITDLNAAVNTIEDHQTVATEVEVAELGTATYDDVQDYINFFGNRTLFSGGGITAHGDADGSIVIAACTAWCKESDSDTAVGKFFDYAGKAKQTLTDLSINAIYLDYNAGTPQIVVATNYTTYGFQQDHILIGAVFRQGTAVHIFESDYLGIGGDNIGFMHSVEHHGAHRSSGLVTSDGGSLALSITTGVIYAGHNRQTTAVNGSTWSYWYTSDSGSTWTEDTSQSVLVQSYNDITSGKVALGTGKYGVHWVYVDYEGSHLHIVYGQGNYNVTQAEEALVPSTLPPIVTGYGVLIAKIINQKTSNDMVITYPWTTVFTSSLATDHNSLANLTVGDVHTQYTLKSLFDAANTILKADVQSTPEGLTVAEQRLVGRITDGVVTALTGAQVMALLSGQAGAAFSLNSEDLSYVGHIGLGNQAASANYGVNYAETLLLEDDLDRAGVLVSIAAYKTSAAYGGQLIGAKFIVTIPTTNTQSWDVGLVGVWSRVATVGTATGKTVASMSSFFADLSLDYQADALKVTDYYGFRVSANTLVPNDKLDNDYGIYVGHQRGGATLNYAIYTNDGIVRFGDNLEMASGKTVDGTDISAHVADMDAHQPLMIQGLTLVGTDLYIDDTAIGMRQVQLPDGYHLEFEDTTGEVFYVAS